MIRIHSVIGNIFEILFIILILDRPLTYGRKHSQIWCHRALEVRLEGVTGTPSVNKNRHIWDPVRSIAFGTVLLVLFLLLV